jgi:uncharacterized DUF497 family protein
VFEWDDENIAHIAEHAVSTDEAEEVFADARRRGVPAYNALGERRWAVVGSTSDGRLLFVVYTRRGGAIRVVAARNASPPNRRSYRRK